MEGLEGDISGATRNGLRFSLGNKHRELLSHCDKVKIDQNLNLVISLTLDGKKLGLVLSQGCLDECLLCQWY